MKLRDYLHDNGLLLGAAAFALAVFALAVLLSIGAAGDGPSAGDWIYAAALSGVVLSSGAAIDFFRRRGFYRRLSEATERLDDAHSASTVDADLAAATPGARGTAAIVARSLEVIERARRREREAWRAERQLLLDAPTARIHELKTPLTSLRLLLGSSGRVPADSEALIPAVEAEVDRLDALLEEALFESRADSFDRDYFIAEVDVRRLVTEAAASLSRAFLAAEVSFAMEDFRLSALSDARWLDFIVRQILLNALKYTPRGGEVRISTRARGGGDELVIRDTGRGIDPRDLPRVFDRGFTGGTIRDGAAAGSVANRPTGMGLYLVKRLCSRLDHGISVESVLGKGSTFSIVLRPHTPFLDPAGRAILSET